MRYEMLLLLAAALVLLQQHQKITVAPIVAAAGRIDSPIYHVYLTVDDGPLHGTGKMLQLFNEEKVNVTVFVVGANLGQMPDSSELLNTYRHGKYVKAGNHSYSHANGHYFNYYRKPALVVQDFLRNQQVLQLRSGIARLPGRNIWRLPGLRRQDMKSGSVAADSLYKRGFRIYGWDLEWQYDTTTAAPKLSASQFKDQVLAMLQSGSTQRSNHIVILAHDEMFWKNWSFTQLRQLVLLLKADPRLQLEHLERYPASP